MITLKTESVGSSSSVSDLSTAQDRSSNSAREKSKRPQLSCNDCRARKVKCDRLQPCTACSLHQIAESCHYELTEAERQPILQAEAIKLKDKEIARLRQENYLLRAQSIYSALPAMDEHVGVEKRGLDDVVEDSKGYLPQCKRPREADYPDNIYFGAPCSASVVKELADLSFDSKVTNFAHGVTSSTTVQVDTTYPFPTLWHAHHGTGRLVDLLPSKYDLRSLLLSFKHFAPLYYFPYVPEECSERGVDRFLTNPKRNALLHPDVLALLFAALAQGVQNGLHGRCGGKWVLGAMDRERKKGDVFIAAAMHSLRTAAFLSKPTLPVVETLVMIGPYLTNSGKFLDAWSLFGITVRLAQRIGLHQDPSQLSPPVPLAEFITRRKLWWWMLHMDQQYSQALGRPLAISSVGDCPSTSAMAHDSVVHGLEVYNAQFTILARQALNAGQLCNAQLDDYIHQLSSLHEILPNCLRVQEDWLDENTALARWPIDVQAVCVYSQRHHLLVWLYRKRAEAIRIESSDSAIDLFGSSVSASSTNTLYGREQVLESCRSILRAFIFIHRREPAAMICWTLGQQAFHAACILLTSMLETRNAMDAGILQQTYSIFVEIQSLGVHSLADGAVERLKDLMDKCSTGGTDGDLVSSNHGMLLLEEPNLQTLGQGVVAPTTCYSTFGLMSRSGGSINGNTMEHEQEDLPVSVAIPKKQKASAGKSSARSRASGKKSTVKQRRSSVPQRRYSGLWMKEKQSPQPGLDSNRIPPMQSSGLANQGGSQSTRARNPIAPPTTALPDTYNDSSPFQPCQPTALPTDSTYEHLATTWAPFQIYTAAPTDSSAPPHDRTIQMQRAYSASYSEPSSDAHPGTSQSSTQFPSPAQSNSFHGGSPHSPLQILPHDLYEHSFFGMSSVQAQNTPALAPVGGPSYRGAEAPACTWQMPGTGFREMPHLAPGSSL